MTNINTLRLHTSLLAGVCKDLFGVLPPTFRVHLMQTETDMGEREKGLMFSQAPQNN